MASFLFWEIDGFYLNLFSYLFLAVLVLADTYLLVM